MVRDGRTSSQIEGAVKKSGGTERDGEYSHKWRGTEKNVWVSREFGGHSQRERAQREYSQIESVERTKTDLFLICGCNNPGDILGDVLLLGICHGRRVTLIW